MPHRSKTATDVRDRPAAPPHAPGGDPRLLCLGYMVMELADETIAEQDLDASQMLVELAMSVFHTAFTLRPELQGALEDTRRRTEAAVTRIRGSLPQRRDGAGQWPDHVM